ncbi:hypothetical protein [Olsenella sp. Marseille-P4559]|uniref:hypothetical protein n=1 Tax=Olsenella sp. Marseille-P4559 TaxID=2364795 RepID=UPI00103070F5|nr:hypothetical protein [Olsenella sp. Marseille-P4559]
MKRNLLIRLTCIAMTVIATLAFVCPAFAEGANDGKILLTRELALEIAQNFADSLDDTGTIKAASATQLYDESGQAIGCIVDYVSAEDNSPHGYLVLDNIDESLVEEYSLDSNVISPYAAAKSAADVRGVARMPGASPSDGQDDDLVAVRTSPYTYAVVVSGTSRGISSTGSIMRVSPTASSKKPSTWDEIFIDETYSGNYQILSDNHFGEQFFSFGEGEIENETGRYACAVTAMTNVAASYLKMDFYNQSLSQTYITLWALSDTKVDHTGKNLSSGREITYGSTNNSEIGPALTSFLGTMHCPVSYKHELSPSFSDFTSITDSQNASIVSLGINTDNGREGHSMAVFGYQTIKGKDTGDTTQVLIVADGWGHAARYVNFAYSRYTDTYGTHFTRS